MTAPRLGAAHALALALALAAAAGAPGCRSFAKLEAHDPTVSEDEVHAAGEERDDPTLTPHLRHILWHREEYPTEVVVAAIVATAARQDRSSVGAIAGLTRCDDEEVRWHAVLALKSLGGTKADATRERVAAEDGSGLVRGAARSGKRPGPASR